jgi:apolipoprotein N-acyltransferase
LILSQAKSRRPLVIALAIVFGCVFAYGAYRLQATPPAPHSIVVGLASSDLKKNSLPQDDASAMQLMRDYEAQAKALTQRGAQVIALPEMTALVRDSISGAVDTLFEEAARSAHVQIVIGLLHVTGNAAFNEARFYSATGELERVYRKHHLVPVVEGRTAAGTDISVLPQPTGKVGLEICRDMDYSNPARRYGRKDVGDAAGSRLGLRC